MRQPQKRHSCETCPGQRSRGRNPEALTVLDSRVRGSDKLVIMRAAHTVGRKTADSHGEVQEIWRDNRFCLFWHG